MVYWERGCFEDGLGVLVVFLLGFGECRAFLKIFMVFVVVSIYGSSCDSFSESKRPVLIRYH